MYAAMIASHAVLCVEAPQGWESLADVDLIANLNVEDKIFELYKLLKEKEDLFRKGLAQDGQAKG